MKAEHYLFAFLFFFTGLCFSFGDDWAEWIKWALSILCFTLLIITWIKSTSERKYPYE